MLQRTLFKIQLYITGLICAKMPLVCIYIAQASVRRQKSHSLPSESCAFLFAMACAL